MQILFWVILSFLFVAIIFLVIFFLRSIFFILLIKKTKKIDQEISLRENDNKTNLQKAYTLKTASSEYEVIYLNLLKLNNDIKETTKIYKHTYHQFNLLFKKHKFWKSLKEYKKVKKIFLQHCKQQNDIKIKSASFANYWSEIEQMITDILDVTEDLKEQFIVKKYISLDIYREMDTKITTIRSLSRKLDNEKTKGNFQTIQNKIEKLKLLTAEFVKLFSASEKIDFTLFEDLPTNIQSNLLKTTKKDFYQKINHQWKEISKNWRTYDATKLIQQIKKIYKNIIQYENEISKRSELVEFISNQKQKFNLLLSGLKKQWQKLNIENKSIMKSFDKIKNSIDNLTKNNKSASDLFQKIESLMNDFYQLQANIFQTKQIIEQNKRIKQTKTEILKMTNLFFSVIEHINLPITTKTDQIKNNCLKIYNEFQKNKFKLIETTQAKKWQNWVNDLKFLLYSIAENQQYYKMYNKLTVFVLENEKFKDKQEESRAHIYNSSVDVKNNDFKSAYLKLKYYIKNT
ncbi:hypothetical protein BCF59_0434 [Mycoplasmopsis mustelae]|uniref:Septation ring formation regulator n=1 Tax=Mycoplasmopsis mustelae TaxID=171289 RepID=A0A4R7UDA2_9BACT|nr:hypothetical protein [Mycoplasmopsis mustelae]TDV24462.1 hypothetical protein BCF59_0434 [Mycoplasmopsis mustelae]